MLHKFLTVNRSQLIDRCRSRVVLKSMPSAAPSEVDYGISTFLDQLIKTLQMEQTTDPLKSRAVSGPSGGGPGTSEMGAAAAQHGRDLLRYGFTVDEVVHDYGNICQAITELASEHNVSLQIDEFRTLNRCLDNAIAGAVTEYSFQRTRALEDQGAEALNERLGQLAHELRDLLHTATLAFTAIKAGNVGASGSTGAVLDRCLVGLRTVIDRSLAEVRVSAGLPVRSQLMSLADFIAEIKTSAALEAQARKCSLGVSIVDPMLAVNVDYDLLCSALGNLLQNAFKFTHDNSTVMLNAYASGDRILIEVEDRCGGLPPGFEDQMFLPFKQAGKDKSGLGLGLSLCKRSVEANSGRLNVRDMPGCGCVFTIDLPRFSLATPPTESQRT